MSQFFLLRIHPVSYPFCIYPCLLGCSPPPHITCSSGAPLKPTHHPSSLHVSLYVHRRISSLISSGSVGPLLPPSVPPSEGSVGLCVRQMPVTVPAERNPPLPHRRAPQLTVLAFIQVHSYTHAHAQRIVNVVQTSRTSAALIAVVTRRRSVSRKRCAGQPKPPVLCGLAYLASEADAVRASLPTFPRVSRSGPI